MSALALRKIPTSFGEVGTLSSRLTVLIAQLFETAVCVQASNNFFDQLQECASVIEEILAHVIQLDADRAATIKLTSSLHEKVATAEKLCIASSENRSVEGNPVLR